MWERLLRLLAKIGIVAAAKVVVEKAEEGPITVGNVVKPAAKAAGKAVEKAAIRQALKALDKKQK